MISPLAVAAPSPHATEKTTVTKESQAFLAAVMPDEGRMTTPATDALYAATRPFHDLLAEQMDRITGLERLLREADSVEERDYVFGFFEQFRQTFGALRTNLTIALATIDKITDQSFQLDTYAATMRYALANRDADIEAVAKAGAVVVLSAAEHAHLLDRVALADALVTADARKTGGVKAPDAESAQP